MKKYLLQILLITILPFLTGLTPVKSNCMALGTTLQPADWEVTIYVRIRDGSLPAAGALVTMTSENNEDNVYSGTAGSDGRVVIENVEEGVYNLDIAMDYFQLYHQEDINISDNVMVNVDLAEACLPPSDVHINATQAVLYWSPPVPESNEKIVKASDQKKGSDSGIRYLLGYNVYLDGVLQGFTLEETFTLVGIMTEQDYIAGVQAVYTACLSDTVSVPFTYYPCEYFNQPWHIDGELSGKDVILTWEFGGSYNYGEYLIKYDNDISDTAIVWEGPGGETAVRFTPLGYPCGIHAFHMFIGIGFWPPGNILSPFRTVIYDDDGPDGLPGTLLGEKEVTPGHYGWVDVDLSDLGVTIMNGQFYLAHYQLGNYPDCPPTGVDGSAAGQGRSYDHAAGAAWGPGQYDLYMIRATGYGPYPTNEISESGIVKVDSIQAVRAKWTKPYKQIITGRLTSGGNESILRDNPPGFNFIGFNVYRGNIKLNDEPLTAHSYIDHPSPGNIYHYNVTIVWDMGESCLHDPPIEIIYGYLYPVPEDLTAVENDEHNIILTWNVPGTTVGEWIHWDDGDNYTSIGLTSGGSFLVASRWTPDDLMPYDSMCLSKIAFFPAGANTQYALKVWIGANASTLVIDQPLSDVTVGKWDTVTLDTPVPIDVTQELWFGYECIDQPAGEYPAGCDAGPAVIGKGDLISTNGVTWECLSSFGLDYNWNLQGWVTTGDKNRMVLEGYNIWKDGSNVQLVPASDTFYIDTGLPPGTYHYNISALYDDGESFTDGPAVITIDASGDLYGQVYDGMLLEPLAQATVTLLPAGYTTVTAADGKYMLTAIPWGSYAMTVTCAGYDMASLNLEVDSFSRIIDVPMYSSNILLPLPFYENWDGGSFNAQYWHFDPGVGHWLLNAQAGNTKPSAEFLWLPGLTGYSYSLISPRLDATGLTQHVALEFDLFLSSYDNTGQEHLTTDVWDGSDWVTVDDLVNDIDAYWQHHTYNISAYALGTITRIRFVAHGSNSSGINNWGIDNIAVHEQPGATLDGTVTDASTGGPVEGAMVGIQGYDPVYTDTMGFYTIEVMEGTYDITYSADGYLPLTDSGINIAGITHHDVALEPEPCDPPLNLTYEIINGDVYLSWDPPEDPVNTRATESMSGRSPMAAAHADDNRFLLGYNIYRDGVKLNTDLIEPTQYVDAGLQNGTYEYCITAVYTHCESIPVCIEVLITDIGALTNTFVTVYPVPARDIVYVMVNDDIRELKIFNYTGQMVHERKVEGEKTFRVNTSGFRTGSYLVEFILDDGKVVTRKMVILK